MEYEERLAFVQRQQKYRRDMMESLRLKNTQGSNFW